MRSKMDKYLVSTTDCRLVKKWVKSLIPKDYMVKIVKHISNS